MPTTTLSTVSLSNHGFAEKLLQPQNNHQLLISTKAFLPGEVISEFSAAETHNQPSRYTVQVAEDKHIILSPEFLQYINHSCNPNVFFNTTTMELVALQPINAGDEFTFFYPSTEWFMADPFTCLCGQPNCIGTIKGAKELTREVIGQYHLTDFIQSKLAHL
jgi:hypothetical protein